MKGIHLNKCSQLEEWITATYGTISKDWIEDTVKKMLYQLNQRFPPIQFGPLFKMRKILKQEYRYCDKGEKLQDERKRIGKLEVEKSGFKVVINRVKGERADRLRERFTIAHEIAHTFFYDISVSPPRRILPRQSDNSEEVMCDKMAAALLLPKWMIDEYLLPYRIFQGTQFNINVLRSVFIKLKKNFKVSPVVIARRLVQDLGLWNMIILGCCWGSKGTKGNTNKDNEEAWRLEWYAKPRWAWEDLFIPSKGFPKIHLETAENLYQSLTKKTYYLESEEPDSNFSLGNLRHFLRKAWGSQENYPIYAAVIRQSHEKASLFRMSENQERELDLLKRRSTKIIVCIPLPVKDESAL